MVLIFFSVDLQPLRVEVRPCSSLRITAGGEEKTCANRWRRRKRNLAAGLKRVMGFTASKLGACLCTRVIVITVSVLSVNTGSDVVLRISITLLKKQTSSHMCISSQ